MFGEMLLHDEEPVGAGVIGPGADAARDRAPGLHQTGMRRIIGTPVVAGQ